MVEKIKKYLHKIIPAINKTPLKLEETKKYLSCRYCKHKADSISNFYFECSKCNASFLLSSIDDMKISYSYRHFDLNGNYYTIIYDFMSDETTIYKEYELFSYCENVLLLSIKGEFDIDFFSKRIKTIEVFL